MYSQLTYVFSGITILEKSRNKGMTKGMYEGKRKRNVGNERNVECEGIEEAETVFYSRKLSWGPKKRGGDRATNLFEGGNTRANKLPLGGGNPDAKSDSHRCKGRPVAFFRKIAGDPGIFAPPLSSHSKRRTFVPSPLLTRERKVIFARARG